MCKEIPLLRACDVELRAAQTRKNSYGVYITLLVYKDARVDMRILDKVFGPMNWQRHHKEINGRLYCTISVWDDEHARWIEKEDVGAESNTEAVKGESSDSFKRAGFCWGIGRELYDAPNISFKLMDDEYMDKNGKIACYAKFRVAEIEYDRDLSRFTKFTVIDKNGNVRFKVAQQAQKQGVEQSKSAANTNSHAEQQNAAQAKSEPAEYVRKYQGNYCVYVMNKWVFLDSINNGAVLAIIATDAEGKYSAVKEKAAKMLAKLKGVA
jgi:hypothetical protein